MIAVRFIASSVLAFACLVPASASKYADSLRNSSPRIALPAPFDDRNTTEMQAAAEQLAKTLAGEPSAALPALLSPGVKVSIGVAPVADVEHPTEAELEKQEDIEESGPEAFMAQSLRIRQLAPSLAVYDCKAIIGHAVCRVKSTANTAFAMVFITAANGLITRIRVSLILKEPRSN
jgi:hypothetical protein